MKDVYRCSACDEIKDYKTNKIYVAWDSKLPKGESQIVAICRKCHNEMKRVELKGVLQLHKYRELK